MIKNYVPFIKFNVNNKHIGTFKPNTKYLILIK